MKSKSKKKAPKPQTTATKIKELTMLVRLTHQTEMRT